MTLALHFSRVILYSQPGIHLARFKVIDALGAPHGGMILRLRLVDGEVPSLRSLKGATMTASRPDGSQATQVTVDGFAVAGGKASDARFKRTGRVDVRVVGDDSAAEPIGLRWMMEGP